MLPSCSFQSGGKLVCQSHLLLQGLQKAGVDLLAHRAMDLVWFDINVGKSKPQLIMNSPNMSKNQRPWVTKVCLEIRLSSLAMFKKRSHDFLALFSAPSVCLGSSDFPRPVQLFLHQGVKIGKNQQKDWQRSLLFKTCYQGPTNGSRSFLSCSPAISHWLCRERASTVSGSPIDDGRHQMAVLGCKVLVPACRILQVPVTNCLF